MLSVGLKLVEFFAFISSPHAHEFVHWVMGMHNPIQELGFFFLSLGMEWHSLSVYLT